jgi:predicted dehydrogenase
MTGPNAGSSFEVTTPSHIASLLQLTSGLVATMTTSFDCAFWTHTFTFNGSEASVRLPDPDEHGGPVLVRRADDPDWQELTIMPAGSRNCRGLGLADFAAAIRDQRLHRASAAIAVHIVDVINAVLRAAEEEQCMRVPALELQADLTVGELPGVDAGG